MPSGQYSYIDIAALDAIRARFAAGDAIAILAPALDEVIWANGPGAALFGYADIGSIIGKEPQIGLPAKRQIMATSGYPQIGKDRSITIRLASGLTSRAVSFIASEIVLPGGEDAILLVAPATAGTWRSPAETAGRAITGLDQTGQHAAIIDAEGKAVAASAAFEGLGIGSEALGALVAEAQGERLVKRMIEAGTAYLPAGFVRLTDEPATHLLVVVDEVAEEDDEVNMALPVAVVAVDLAEMAEPAAESHGGADGGAEVLTERETAELQTVEASRPEVIAEQIVGEDAAEPQPAEVNETAEQAKPTPQVEAPTEADTADPRAVPRDNVQSTAIGSELPSDAAEGVAVSKEQAGTAEQAEEPASAAEAATTQHDNWYFSDGGRVVEPEASDAEASEVEATEPHAPTVIADAATEEVAPLEVRTEEPAAEADTQAAAEDAPSDKQALEEVDGAVAASGEAVATGEATAISDEPAEALDQYPADGAEAMSQPADEVRHPAPAETVVDRAAVPVRFVWKTDAEGRFSEISDEFVATVGRPAADLIGVKFSDAAQKLGIDPAGEIAGLLERRDTWSGRSLLWPVAGTDLRIPVDLAALPSYGRDRLFAGFRGFGVARAGDAVVDPDALGLALVGEKLNSAGEPATDDLAAAAQEADASRKDAASARDDATRQEGAPAQPSSDPFHGEVPALSIAPKQDRRQSDKVIQLAQHRPPANEKGLSAGERNAFREIGDRLRKESDAPTTEPQLRADNDHGRARHTAQEPAAEAESTQPAEADTTADNLQAAAEAVREFLAASEEDRPVETAQAEAEHVGLAGGEAETPSPAAVGTPETEHTAELEAGLNGAGSAVGPAAAEAEVSGEQASAEPTVLADGGASAEGVTPTPSPSPQGGGGLGSSAAPGHTLTALDERAATSSPSFSWAGDAEARSFMPSAFAPSPASSQRGATDTTILEQLPVPVLIHSGDVLHYANREFLELTGYDSVVELEATGGLGALFGEPYASEDGADEPGRKLRLRTNEGLEYPVEAFLQSVPWGEGKALLLSLRRSWRQPVSYPAIPANAAQAPVDPDFEERIAEMRAIVDTATDGVVLISRDGAIRSISRPAEALFGFDTEEVTGKPFTSLFAIESQRAARDYLNGLSENGVASVLNDGREVIGRESQGRFIPLFMTIGKLPNDNGFCAVVRDITQWKRAEEELTQARAQAERASSQKTEFLARVSHEIRTPLNAIIGFSELMLDEKFGPITNDRYRDYLRDINRSGNHVLDLVNDLLDISKIEAGQQEMSYEAVSLNDTLAETVAMMQPQANRERVIIRSSFASRLPEVVADLRSVRQIALNLMSNAIRYTPAGGQVIVSTAYEASGDVVMRVRDTGIGMSQAEIEQALKPFKQINALKRARGDGTGLGLPLTKAMVEANRARFMINSTPGEGTLVEITFPSTRVLAD